MRITFLSAVGVIGGAETSLLALITGLRRVAPEARLGLIVGEGGPMLERARGLGVEAHAIALGDLRTLGDSQLGRPGIANLIRRAQVISRCAAATPAFIRYARRLRAAIAQAQPDVVHCNGMKMHLIGACSTPAGIPVIWQIHDYLGSRVLMRTLLRLGLRRGPLLVGVSRNVTEDIRTSFGYRPERVACVYNSVDQDIFSVDGPCADLDRMGGLEPPPAGTIKIGLVGTFARWKGHEIFLAALAALPRDIPFRAYIVGAPVYSTPDSQYSLDELKASCRNHGITDRVAFTGFCDRPAEVYRALDIVVHASVAPEPFGMVLAEAMSTGTPIVTTASGGAAELCADRVDCLVCRPGDAASMARAIAALAVDGELRRRLAAAALVKASELFHPDRAAAEMLSLYRRVIGGSELMPFIDTRPGMA